MKRFAQVSGTVILAVVLPAAAFAQAAAHDAHARAAVPGLSQQDPIAAVGHGALVDRDGQSIEVTLDFVRDTQQHYIERLRREATSSVGEQLRTYEQRLDRVRAQRDLDPVLRQTLVLGWLIERVAPEDAERLRARNKTLTVRYLRDIAKRSPKDMPLDYASGLPKDLLDLVEPGVRDALHKVTNANGAAYVAECRKAGVPIPPDFDGPDWDGADWTDNGPLTTDFLSISDSVEVFYHESESPAGTCIALPRQTGGTISALGVICLGRDSGNACFWDRGTTAVGADLAIDDFVGGTDLSNGTCSDCHAGENPFIIHPDTALDIGSTTLLASPDWHDPLMKPSWPQNPGPDTLLGLIALGENDNSCLDCHHELYAGRFPEVGVLPGYCGAVLTPAIAQTMPPKPASMTDAEYADYKDSFDKHADALLAFCQQGPPDGSVVPVDPIDDDPGFISAPIVIGPLYACAEAIEVRGVIFGAKLEVIVDGVAVNSVEVTEPDEQIVKVPPLLAGQVVTAVQTKDGATSDKADEVTVHDHEKDYPNGLPKPVIDPDLVHQCGRVIAVRHVRGAEVTVLVNGASPRSVLTGGDWTNIAPAKRPFDLGDVYTAEQRMCTDKSPSSDPRTAVAPPAPMPVPVIDDLPVVEGQELVDISALAHGAVTRVNRGGFGTVSSFSTAVSWNSDVDVASAPGGPLSQGESLTIESELCEPVGAEFPPARPCDDIAAPIIRQPLVGETTVTVLDAVPGARILVYDKNQVEIGDSAGSVIALAREIEAGDVLTVVQKVGDCTSKTGYVVTALCTSTAQDCQ